jgi:hypothetical protein
MQLRPICREWNKTGAGAAKHGLSICRARDFSKAEPHHGPPPWGRNLPDPVQPPFCSTLLFAVGKSGCESIIGYFCPSPPKIFFGAFLSVFTNIEIR